MKDHISKNHEGRSKYQCNSCEAKFDTLKELKRHVISNHQIDGKAELKEQVKILDGVVKFRLNSRFHFLGSTLNSDNALWRD